eukprot:Awhi_evm1s1977
MHIRVFEKLTRLTEIREEREEKEREQWIDQILNLRLQSTLVYNWYGVEKKDGHVPAYK